MAALFIDVKSEFDNVEPTTVAEIMAKNVTDKIIWLIWSMIKKDSFYSRSTAHTNQTKGLPQDSVLSPTLFNIYIFQVPEQTDIKSRCLDFADDFVAYCANKNKHC